MITVLIFVLGLAIGSFINAALWRLKTKRSILKGRSMCPNCKHQLGGLDLIPVISWVALRGRCRYCGKPISAQYPAVELLTAVLFSWSFLAWNFTSTYSQLQFAIWLVILGGLIFLAVYDLKWMLLPDVVLLPLIALALVRLGIGLVFGVEANVVLWQLATALISGGFFYALFALSAGKWMGGGDVKLAFLMGLLLPPASAVVGFILAFNVAAIVSISLIVFKRLKRKDLIPFGPFLIGATFVAMLYGTEIFEWYLRVVTLY